VEIPVVLQYQQALDTFRREGREPPLLKRMSELISLLDFTTTLSSPLSRDEILDAALLVVMGELQAGRGGLFVRNAGGSFELRALRGIRSDLPTACLEGLSGDRVLFASGAEGDVVSALGLEILCPVTKAGRAIAFLGLGKRANGSPYGAAESTFLRSVASCAATPIENGLMYQELRRVNQRLEVSVFQLKNLFEIARELTSSLDEETIKNLVTTTLMGHLLVSRCALYLAEPGGLALAHGRGLQGVPALVPERESQELLRSLKAPIPIRDLPSGLLRDGLLGSRLSFCIPLGLGGLAQGLVAVGNRVSGEPLTEQDLEFATTLGRQALVALETVRLHEVRLQKQRQDRELQIAREIQQSLFPASSPEVPGFEMAAVSRPCQQVGGDLYDLIPIGPGRTALAIADVSGKGTPASLLMASLHASLRALAGTLGPTDLIERVNRFLYASTQDNKYVTLFYGELESPSGRFIYVNAGHIPPLLLRSSEPDRRLTHGGPVLGLLEDASFEVGTVDLRPGDIVAMVTDGATEALSPEDEEFGDDRVALALRSGGASAQELLRSLVEAVHAWTGAAGCTDDLTALILKTL
jgi:sigma-B regulation protein RsbU (phosphoserine phosphatase)